MADEEAKRQVDKAIATWRRSTTGFMLELDPESEEDREYGIRRFSYAAPEYDWTIEGWAHVRDGRPIIRNLTIGHASGEEVTAGLVKSVPVGKIAASLRTVLVIDSLVSLSKGQSPAIPTSELLQYSRKPLQEVLRYTDDEEDSDSPEPARHTGGRAPLSDDLLREVAELYLTETAAGKPKKPLGRMAKTLGRPEETVRTWVARARKEGWLGPGTRGRTGAEPGPRLLAEYARIPFAESTGEARVTIAAPPAEGTETAEEAEQRALAIWRRKVERGEGGPRPNAVNITLDLSGDRGASETVRPFDDPGTE